MTSRAAEAGGEAAVAPAKRAGEAAGARLAEEVADRVVALLRAGARAQGRRGRRLAGGWSTRARQAGPSRQSAVRQPAAATRGRVG